MPKKEKKDRPIFKGRSHKSFLNQCHLKLVTLRKFELFLLHQILFRPVPDPLFGIGGGVLDLVLVIGTQGVEDESRHRIHADAVRLVVGRKEHRPSVVVLSPDFLDDRTGAFSWIPFECKETVPCVLCAHQNDCRESLKQFMEILRSFYR